MLREYFIPEKGLSDEDQMIRDEITCIRISKVIDYITEEKPNLIPFKVSTPLVNSLDYNSFSKTCSKFTNFEETPRFIKEIVNKAEKMKFYDSKFRKHLMSKDMTVKEYNAKNPKTKQDIFYDWLFLFQIGEEILDL